MRKEIRSLCSLTFLALLVCIVSAGTHLNAQQSTQDQGAAAPPQTQTQPPPAQPPDQSQPAPDPQAQSPTPGSQVFSGTIVKSGDKFMLQDSGSGNTYEIDRQDLARSHEGQKVRISGTLDPNGKLIHVK